MGGAEDRIGGGYIFFYPRNFYGIISNDLFPILGFRNSS